MGDKFYLGNCSNCRQRAEVHEGTDGLAYCEDCLVMLGKDLESAGKSRELPSNPNPHITGAKTTSPQADAPKNNNRCNELIDFIVSRADDEWVEKFLRACRDDYSWVSLLELEKSERKLLRYATELGYGKDIEQLVKEKVSIPRPHIFIGDSFKETEHGKAEESRPNKVGRGRAKGSAHRAGTKKASQSLGVPHP